MDSNLYNLPPNKRFKSIHHKQQYPDPQSKLPAKKRKTILPEHTAVAAGFSYSLPAKKRVWALRPDFDLNADYIPSPDDAKSLLDSDDSDDSDDGIVCAICQSTDGDPSDPIVLCDGCNLMVHVSCYGSPLIHGIPDGDWFCAQCTAAKETSPNDASFSCCLCPNLGGAMKPVVAGDGGAGKWAHVVCAVFVPEVFFKDAEGREGIDCSNVPKRRFEDECYVCERAIGCVVNCSEPKCRLAFHVTCGLKEELCIEYRQGKKKCGVVAGFCKTHSALWKKQEATGKYKIVAREE